MPTKLNVKGTIIEGGASWLWDFLGVEYTASGDFVRQLEAAGGGPVVVEINSPGGYVHPAVEIYEAIRTYPGDIECRVVGQAASAASFIACAAKSSITPMGTFFIHNCIGSAEGNHNDMRQAMQAMESIDENIMGAYRAKTGMDDAEIYALMEENTTLNARRAVELGFIDRITESAADLAQAAGAKPGIAAGAAGFLDLMAMPADHLAAIRAAYEEASSEGGEKMEDEEILDAQPVEDGAEPVEAAEAVPEVAEGEAPAVAAEPAQEDGGGEAEGDAEPVAADGGAAGDATQDGEAPADADADVQAAYDRGVLDERARIQAIMDIAPRVPDAMVRAALYTEPITAEELALAALRAEEQRRDGYLQRARADVAASHSAEVSAEVSDAPAIDAKDEQKKMLAAALNRKFSK